MMPASNMKLFTPPPRSISSALSIASELISPSTVKTSGHEAPAIPPLATRAWPKPPGKHPPRFSMTGPTRCKSAVSLGSPACSTRPRSRRSVGAATLEQIFLVDCMPPPFGIEFQRQLRGHQSPAPGKLEVMPPTQGVRINNELLATGSALPPLIALPKRTSIRLLARPLAPPIWKANPSPIPAHSHRRHAPPTSHGAAWKSAARSAAPTPSIPPSSPRPNSSPFTRRQ